MNLSTGKDLLIGNKENPGGYMPTGIYFLSFRVVVHHSSSDEISITLNSIDNVTIIRNQKGYTYIIFRCMDSCILYLHYRYSDRLTGSWNVFNLLSIIGDRCTDIIDLYT